MGRPLVTPDSLAPLFGARRLGLLTDFDGTIAAIAVRPEGAAVSPAARAALATLIDRLPLVGVISGRALFDLRSKLDLPGLLYIGSHGLAWWFDGTDELPEEALPYVDLAARVTDELEPLRRVPGIRFEDKGTGLALHYRFAPDPEAARAQILAACAATVTAQEFELREGILVVELFPRLRVNKGTAVRAVVKRFALDGLLFFGDDLTDVDAIYATGALREAGSVVTASIAVSHAESPPIAAEAADWTVDGVAGVERILEWLVERLPPRPAEPAHTARGRTSPPS